MRTGRLKRSRPHARAGLVALLIFAIACLTALLVSPRSERAAPFEQPLAPGAAVDTNPDARMAPLEAAEGAVGTVPLPNAGAAVNPITPTGDAGGPAGQTPAYGEPGGAPSRVVRP